MDLGRRRRSRTKESEDNDIEFDNDPCLLYLAQSTIPNAGLGVFAGTSFKKDELIGRVGDAAFPTVDQDWHNSPSEHTSFAKHEGDYHWPLTNYDWMPSDIGMMNEAEDVSATVTGFGAAPNCHFRLLNVNEHKAFNIGGGVQSLEHRRVEIVAGSELFVDYGPNWFLSRDGIFQLVPLTNDYERAQEFLKEYGRLLVGSDNPNDLVDDKMSLDDDAQRDLWNVIKTFPYPTRARQALPDDHRDAIRAIHGDIQTIEKENSIRSVSYLKEYGKCMDNIVPGLSDIPHAGRGAFATRFIPKGGLVAPAPVVHIADKSVANMYNETIGRSFTVVRDEAAGVITKQIITNYMFGHKNSTLLLFPYSSNVAYINHHSTKYNAGLRWAKDFSFYHHEEWLNKSVEFLEEHWTSGLMLEFIALRDILVGEEVLINYGDEWQMAWDEHVKHWQPTNPESDHNNLTLWTKYSESNNGRRGYVRAEELDNDEIIKTMNERLADPYPHGIMLMCTINVNHDTAYLSAPKTIPFFRRSIGEVDLREDSDDKHIHNCNVTERYEADEDYEESEDEEESHNLGRYMYTVLIEVKKPFTDDYFITEVHEIRNVPRSSISFVNIPYTSDIFLKNSFRHEMMLPDDIFPKAWMNLMP
ncbi:hypothetical protein ACHAXA_003202 [Cyclostephanos tholiformis]|uniref:SET domain-containing protein n=1 Tax=Cyclostephanos tholiformis TaxID=382380 RepID=A0ABD3RYK5_9STRA